VLPVQLLLNELVWQEDTTVPRTAGLPTPKPHCPMSLPISIQITGIDRMPILAFEGTVQHPQWLD
jgi:hypothetical protein